MTDHHDYCLRGPDRETTRAVLLAAGLTFEYEMGGDVYRVPSDGVSLSVVGTIYNCGEWDVDGNEVAAAIARPGWHVNLRMERPLSADEEAALAELLVAPGPATPYRVWAE